MSNNTKDTKKDHNKNDSGPLPFEDYISYAEAAEGVKQGTHLVGQFGVTKYGHSRAFVKNPMFPTGDCLVDGWHDRNRALPGDVVIVQLRPQEEWNQRDAVQYENKKLGVPELPKSERKTVVDVAATRRLLQATFGRKEFPDIFLLQPPPVPTDMQPTAKVVHILQKPYGKPLKDRIVVGRMRPPQKRHPDKDKHVSTPSTTTSTTSERKDEGKDSWPPKKTSTAPATSSVFLPQQGGAGEEKAGGQDPNTPQSQEKQQTNADPPIEYGKNFRFVPDDDQYPHIEVYTNSVPADILPSLHTCVFTVRFHCWDKKHFYPVARFERMIGEMYTIDAETEAILSTCHIEHSEFEQPVQDQVNVPFNIPDTDTLKQMQRRDLRKEVIACTIDPATAKDLDDALSCRDNGDGTFQVGVHIADVSHFVPADSPVDMAARDRLTTTYMVQKAFPMLPRILSEEYCSLNANSDKFAFTCLWTVNDKGEVLDEWMGKTVIHNYCKMSYQIAQSVLDGNENDEDFFLGDIPDNRKPRLLRDIKESVKNLNKIAQTRRKKRFSAGALSLSRGVLSFDFPLTDVKDKTGKRAFDISEAGPKTVKIFETQDANHLVEEFMLLANIRVAMKLCHWMPTQAMLRSHGGPLAKKLGPVIDALERDCNITLEAHSGYALNSCLAKLVHHPLIDLIRVITTYCMPLAAYVCADNDEGLFHFGLNESVYTHFTSPIRRYPDVMVHRALQFVLELEAKGIEAPPVDPAKFVTHENIAEIVELWHEREKEGVTFQNKVWDDFGYDSAEVTVLAKLCNESKLQARKAGELSRRMFFCLWLRGQTEQYPNGLPTYCHVIKMDTNKKPGFTVFLPEYAADCSIDEISGLVSWAKIVADKETKTVWLERGEKRQRVQLLMKFNCRLIFAPTFQRLDYTTIIEPLEGWEKEDDKEPLAADENDAVGPQQPPIARLTRSDFASKTFKTYNKQQPEPSAPPGDSWPPKKTTTSQEGEPDEDTGEEIVFDPSKLNP